MHDARDAEDALLLEAGDHAALIAAYADVVVQRCLVGTRDESGRDVAQNVFLRLWQELRRGKRYAVPYRVVVHQVITWTLKEHFAGGRTELPLPEGWDPADPVDQYADVDDSDLDALWSDLAEGDRRVLDLRYVEGLEVPEIAERLGKAPNAVHQALHRAHAKLRKLVDGG
jgi:RNA polymerase sigma-70 factor (ECF subfamily)